MNPLKIGLVVHGPEIVDSGYAQKFIEFLGNYGVVKSRLGGTMGRTAVIDAHLEDKIDISQKLFPSQSVDKFNQENCDVIFLINYGKSSVTGHAFGYKVYNNSQGQPPLIQIERPGEEDGSVVAWRGDLEKLAEDVSIKLGLLRVSPDQIKKKLFNEDPCQAISGSICRKIAGVSPDENIFVNGIVIGKSKSSDVAIITEDGIIIDIVGGELKKHGVEKLGTVNLERAIVKTGLLRKSIVEPRIIKSEKSNNRFTVSYLNHAAEDIYRLKNADMVVTVGDDTTLVAADILYRFNVPIIGITDGDVDKVVEEGHKAEGSLIIELDAGFDDLAGDKVFLELFNRKETIEIENIENFKSKLLQIISEITSNYKLIQ
ncbi:MAG: hypothetical protein A4E25_00787 [Methanobacterium sp. PtaB.Bin024]|nr:MAG: hypothetical protein A4E25_00787 [Methanobacterium sp. PtaB.Bin024]